MARIRLGACSPTAADSLQASLALLEKLARQAAKQGVDLLLLPEAFLGGGYPRGKQFGSINIPSTDATAVREAFLHYFHRAVDFGDIVGDAGAGGGNAWIDKGRGHSEGQGSSSGDGTREMLEHISQETGVFLVVGAIERAGGSLYCSMVYVCPQRGMLGKRRKVQPTGLEQLIWSPAGPATLRAVSTEIKGVRINLAAAIGCENYMPLVRQSLYAQNINLYLALTADDTDAWLALTRTIGIEGRCFVVTSNTSTTAPSPAALSNSTASTEQPPTFSNPQWQSTKLVVGGPSTAAAEGPKAGANGAGITTKIVDCAPSCAGGKPRRRKKSFVVDEYGNEIVLSCETVVEETGETANGFLGRATNKTIDDSLDMVSDAPLPLPPFPRLSVDQAWERHKQERRRSSVFDEDDNEIVLCRPQDPVTDSATDHPFGDSASENSTEMGPGPLREDTAGKDGSQRARPQAAAPHGAGTEGGAAVVSPFGVVLAGPQGQGSDAAGIVVADIEFEDCIRGRLDFDVAGHHSRNDSFKLSVEGLQLTSLSN